MIYEIHIGHQNIIKYCPWNRPFSCVEDMDLHLITMWNSTVKPLDLVYFLGDFSMRFGIALKVLPRLNGRKILISGNHDAWFNQKFEGPATHSSVKEMMDADPFIEEITMRKLIKIGDKDVLLCHFPWLSEPAEDSTYKDKFAQFKPSRNVSKFSNTFLLHGHLHSPPEKRLGKDSLDVGFDGAGKMISEEEILEIIKTWES